jgi:outer membrane protein assembly factor BamB
MGRALKLSILAALLAAALLAYACGKSHVEGRDAIQVTNPNSPQSLEEAQAQLAALACPDGVDAALWAQLKSALDEALRCRAGTCAPPSGSSAKSDHGGPRVAALQKTASTPPTGEANRVNDLAIADNGDGTYTLSWHYRNLGDYDQNGTVAVEDIIPLAQHFGETWVSGEENTLAAIIDGSVNGRVGIEDITPLAANMGVEVTGYSLQLTEDSGSFWSEFGSIALTDATGDGRILFSVQFEKPERQREMRVSPQDSLGANGVTSKTVSYPNRGDWWMYGHDPQHTGLSPFIGCQSGRLDQRIPMTSFSSSPVIGADGTLYSGGAFFWHYEAGDASLWYVTSEEKTIGSPALGLDGTVYAGSLDNFVYAIEPNCNLKWRFETGDYKWNAPTIAPDGTIIVGSADGFLYALSPKGDMLWSYEAEGGIGCSPAIGTDGTIYFTCWDHYMYALSPYGNLLWRIYIGGSNCSPSIAADGTIYVAGEYLHALHPDGTIKWECSIDSDVSSYPAIGTQGTVYVTSNIGLRAISDIGDEGVVLWVYETPDYAIGGPAIDANETIYFGTWDGTFYALSPDGSLLWSYKAEGGINGSPAIASDGTVFISSHDGYMYAFRDEVEP